jgi:hypothetical protein
MYSDSSEEEDSFNGFTVRDHRDFTPIAERIEVYNSTPKPARKKRRNSRYSDEYLEGELSIEVPAQTAKAGNNEEIKNTENEAEHMPHSGDSDVEVSDIEGDFSIQVFSEYKRRVVEETSCSSSEETDGDSINGCFSFDLDTDLGMDSSTEQNPTCQYEEDESFESNLTEEGTCSDTCTRSDSRTSTKGKMCLK